jgi:hypothetical protein
VSNPHVQHLGIAPAKGNALARVIRDYIEGICEEGIEHDFARRVRGGRDDEDCQAAGRAKRKADD